MTFYCMTRDGTAKTQDFETRASATYWLTHTNSAIGADITDPVKRMRFYEKPTWVLVKRL